MPEQPSAEKSATFSREQAENAFRAALNLFVGRGRRYSSKQVEIATGVSHRIIDCFRSYEFGHPDYRPLHMGAQLSIAGFLGAGFTTELLKPTGQIAVAIPEGLDLDEYECQLRDWLRRKGEAHRPDSPGGREIAPCEQDELARGAANIRAFP
ncbi:hypothetical protein ACQEPB_00380 [Novosphingobium fluoreni]|uniref:hypothetical protein n=1 Tax=Novosphingobium fluoreni TaxID=1391222 RepID=UPI003DA0E6D7